MTPGEYLREVRESAGRTLKDVAALYGCSVPFLSDLERNRREIPRRSTHRIALCEDYGADPTRLESLIAKSCGRIDISDLSDKERVSVAEYVQSIRAARSRAA